MSLANRLGTKVYSHLKYGIKKFDFLVDLNSMSDLLFFRWWALYSVNAPQFIKLKLAILPLS